MTSSHSSRLPGNSGEDPAERRIAIAGVTGFIGRGLPEVFSSLGWKCTGVSRFPDGGMAGVDVWQTPETLDFSGHDAVVNLAGEPIIRRWTEKRFARFRESRVGITEKIVAAIAGLPEGERPRVLVNGSAVGIYGDRGEEILDEDAAPGGGKLAALCVDWEAAARRAEESGVRVVLLRTGIVLGKNGGAYGRMAGVFRFGLGGKLGNGRHWMPWIHLADMRALIAHAVVHGMLRGPVNAVAPVPMRNAEFTKKLASSFHRPAVFPVPAIMLKLIFGELGGAMLESQRAIPTALLETGFRFRFPEVREALKNLACCSVGL